MRRPSPAAPGIPRSFRSAHSRPLTLREGAWVPAFAGMTREVTGMARRLREWRGWLVGWCGGQVESGL